MICLDWAKREVTKNKKRTGAIVGNTCYELKRILDEWREAVLAYNKEPEKLGEELADIILFVLAVADNENIDITKEIIDKIEKNKHRVWK